MGSLLQFGLCRFKRGWSSRENGATTRTISCTQRSAWEEGSKRSAWKFVFNVPTDLAAPDCTEDGPVHQTPALFALGAGVQHPNDRPSELALGFFPHPLHCTTSLQLPRVSTMIPKSQQQKEPDGALSKLNEAIEDINRAKDVSNVAPAKAVFGLTSDLLPTIRVSSVSIPSIAS